MNDLTGRRGIVTGGSSGIGYAICNRLAEEGAVVYAVSRTGAVKEGLAPSHQNVIHIQADITDFERMQQVVSAVAADGPIDFLVNDAGITQKYRAEEFPIDEFRRIMEVNVTAIFRLCQLCYPYLKESRFKGRIVSISSMAAHLGFSLVTPYCISKSAVLGITRGLAIEWANDNICVNSVAPGWFPSEMNKQVMTPERKAAILARMPVHTFGDPNDIGSLIAFLLSDAASYITGQDFAIDGGALAYGF